MTKQEFRNYYTNVSASIDDDDYFELMLRNAWHISGGSGWCENTANRRVLVTHNDGTQSVQEIKHDLGLRSGNTDEAMRRLHHQGARAQSVSFFGGGEGGKDKFERRGPASTGARPPARLVSPNYRTTFTFE